MADIHQKKIMLSVWWDWKHVVYFELQPEVQTIILVVCCEQLDELNTFIKEIGQS